MVDRGRHESTLNDLALYEEALTNADRIQQILGTGKAILMLELIENPDAPLDLNHIAAASIAGDDMRQLITVADASGHSQDIPLREIPPQIALMLAEVMRNEELFRLDLEELRRIKTRADHMEASSPGIQSQADIYGDDALYYPLVRETYGTADEFIQAQTRIAVIQAEEDANREFQKFGDLFLLKRERE